MRQIHCYDKSHEIVYKQKTIQFNTNTICLSKIYTMYNNDKHKQGKLDDHEQLLNNQGYTFNQV